jgi:peptidoglycan hydrolase-like protein with peptidoglycan-binding domain
VSYPSLASGDQGADVERLQQLLRDHGFDPGPVDGNFGSRTEQAVLSFARERQLPDTGRVDDEFWVHLLSSGEMAPQLMVENPHVVQNSDVSLLVYAIRNAGGGPALAQRWRHLVQTGGQWIADEYGQFDIEPHQSVESSASLGALQDGHHHLEIVVEVSPGTGDRQAVGVVILDRVASLG